MYDVYGPIKNGNTYTFTVYAPNANNIVLRLNNNDYTMVKVGDDFVVSAPANHMDTYHFMIDGVEKFDPFARYIQDGLVSTVYESSYEFQNLRPNIAVGANSKILQVYLPYISGNTYAEKASEIISKFQLGNYTHLIIMPIHHHWYIGSLGYHPQGFFAPSWFYGEPDSLKEMIDTLHGAGIPVLLDFIIWEFTETPENNALSNYDGTMLYEENLLQSSSFGGFYLDLTKPYVKDFIKSSLQYWVDEYKIDGFRLDGINEIVFNAYHEALPDKVNIVNEITQSVDAEILLEFISEQSTEQVGLIRDNLEGSLLSFMILNYLETGDVYAKGFIDSKMNIASMNDRVALHHDLFMNGFTTMNIYEEQRAKNLEFIMKLLYTSKKSKIIFGHIDVYSSELDQSLKDFFAIVDSVWNDQPIFEIGDGYYSIKHNDTTFIFTPGSKQVTII